MRRTLAAVLVAAASCSTSTPPAEHRAPPAPAVAPVAAATAPVPSKPGLVEGGVRPHHEDAVVECPAKIPDSAEDDTRVGLLLDEANKQIEAGGYAAAWTCADRAADLSPSSVEANHLRAAALAGLGRDSEAEVAYQLALALDPDDPETLRAVADFY